MGRWLRAATVSAVVTATALVVVVATAMAERLRYPGQVCTTLSAHRLRAPHRPTRGALHHSTWLEAWTAAGTRTSQTRR